METPTRLEQKWTKYRVGRDCCHRIRPSVCRYSNIHLLIKSNNQGVIQAINGRKSRSPEQNAVLQCITLLLNQHNLWISPSYVPSLDNLADRPSHGLPAINRSHTDSTFLIPSILQPFLLHTPTIT